PWGATEAHNYHLPYGTDVYQVSAIAAEAARLAWEGGARVGVLPTLPFGVQTGQMDIPFCINMNPSTQLAVLDDVIVSLIAAGVPKLVVLNGHGGNDFRQMLRELQFRHPRLFLCEVNWFKVPVEGEPFERPGDHADERETSLMLHLEPQLVLPQAEWGDGSTHAWRIPAMKQRWAWAQRAWTRATNDTGSGDPRLATAEKGAAYLAALTQQIGSFFRDLATTPEADLYE
ncbi:MAG: creatininase family protein, partial [Verrucomicrobiales bacterium]|nr:creatininase family protein [Verrucomicrobiales bacterium]